MPLIGEIVRVAYTAALEDGTVFASADETAPLEFRIGDHDMPPLFEKAVSELFPGEEARLHLEPQEAFGVYDQNLVLDVPRQALGGAEGLEPGQRVTLRTQAGVADAHVVAVSEHAVRLDCNHELAGRAINYDVKLLAVLHEPVIEREKHPAGCACGCDKVKEVLLA